MGVIQTGDQFKIYVLSIFDNIQKEEKNLKESFYGERTFN